MATTLVPSASALKERVYSAASRFHGHGKIGRVSRIDQDRTSVRETIRDLGSALRDLDRLASPENGDLPGRERKMAETEVHSRLNLARRTLHEVLARNGYEMIDVVSDEDVM